MLLTVSSGNCSEVKELDTNSDGKADKWLYTLDDKLMKLEEDFNFDGIVDKRAQFYYKNGEKDKVEIDSNMDGKADGWSYHKEGFRYRIESDTNYDGKLDYIADISKDTVSADSDYDNWLFQNRPEFTNNMSQYMKNTNYKKITGSFLGM